MTKVTFKKEIPKLSPHLVLPTLQATLGDRSLVDLGPVGGALISLLKPVAGDHGAAIFPGGLPGQGHGGLGVISDGWFLWWPR